MSSTQSLDARQPRVRHQARDAVVLMTFSAMTRSRQSTRTRVSVALGIPRLEWAQDWATTGGVEGVRRIR